MYSRLIAKRVGPVERAVTRVVQKFVYDGTQIVLVCDDSGSLENRLLYGPAVDQFFADENALGEVLCGLTDHIGTVRDLVEYDALADTSAAG